jgi:hypothetical protein
MAGSELAMVTVVLEQHYLQELKVEMVAHLELVLVVLMAVMVEKAVVLVE